jgi:hypothetical protein
MWSTLYTQTLNGDSALGANYNYVVELPAVSPGDAYLRIALRAPASGQSRVQEMYIGHGSGYSFDGNQVPVTVNGSPSFTLSSGLTYSDPILASSLGFDASKKLICAYGLLSGDAYRRNNSLSANFGLHYKVGSGDAATTSKSGYTSISGWTAIIEAIQFADAVPEAPLPLPLAQSETEGYVQLLNGERHSSGGEVSGAAGKYLHIQFRNPTGTGKTGFLYEVEIAPEADTVMSLRSYNDAIGSVFPKCNLMFAFGPGSMEARWSNENSILGNFHSIHKLKGGERNVITLDVPLVGLTAGRGVVMALHAPNVGAVANVQWREVPA